MTSFTRWLDEVGPSDAALVGAKAANLARMMSLGLAVPTGFCVTTCCYDRFVADNELDGLLDLRRWGGEPQKVDSRGREARDAILRGRLPDELVQSLHTAWRRLEDSCGGSLRVAVRSSSTVEDLAGSSYAGVFETFLGIGGPESVEDRIKECWASLWAPAATSWALSRGIDPDVYSMAVVVQRMVEPEVAGVLFTADPITGNRWEVVISAAWGLGEGVVSDQVESDRFVVSALDLTVTDRRIARKRHMSACDGSGLRSVPDDRRAAVTLSEDEIVRLARLGLALQDHYDAPQDVEWAIEKGSVFLTQTRPVTALPPFFPIEEEDERDLPFTKWKVEFRTLLSPFGRSLERKKNPVYRGALGRALGVEITNHQTTFNGYVYHHEVVRRTAVPVPVFRAMQLLRSLYRSRDADRAFYDEAIPKLTERLNRIRATCVDTLDDRVRLLDDAVRAYLDFEADAVSVGVLANQLTSLLLRFASRIVGEDGTLAVSSLFVGLPNKTLERDDELLRLQELARDKGLLPVFGSAQTLQELHGLLCASADGSELLARLESFRRRFGYIWADGNVKDPGWKENVTLLKAMFEHADPTTARRREDVSPSGAQPFAEQVREHLAGSRYDRLFPIRRLFFCELHSLVRRYYPCREDYNHYLASCVMVIREILHEYGEALVRLGVCGESADAFFLEYEEVRVLPKHLGQGQAAQYRDKIRRRSTDARRQSRLTPPIEIDLGEGASTDVGPASPSSGRTLYGSPGSSGEVVGSARVVMRANLSSLKRGEILICDTFRPEWSHVLMYIGGMVTDRGYMLSHGANLAREAGIPAVMGARVATQEIHDGDRIRLNGQEGIVEILSQHPTGGHRGRAFRFS